MDMGAPLGQAIPFVHPGLAGLAVAAGLVPVVIHFINRRRYREVRWAAMSFLLAARQKSRRRMQLQHYLLMSARILGIVLLGAAVARPFLPASAMVGARFARTHHIFLLDNSLSMQASGRDGITRFEHGKNWVLSRLAAIPENDSVSLVTMAAPAVAVIGHEAYDRRILRDHLSDVRQTERTSDFPGAVAHAVRLLQDSTAVPGNRSVYVVSDFPSVEWQSDIGGASSGAASALQRLADTMGDGADQQLYLVRSTAVSLPHNLAVTRLSPVSSLMLSKLPISVEVEVTNFGSAKVRDAALHISRDGVIVRRDKLAPLEPGARASFIFSMAFAEGGVHTVEATVHQESADGLAVDDSRFLSVEVSEQFRALIVDGRPGPTKLSGEAGYLATALSSASRILSDSNDGGAATRLRDMAPSIDTPVISISELDAESPASYDMIALCNVQQPAAAQWARLERYASRGGGVLLFAGDLVDTAGYNRDGYSDGKGLLPVRLSRVPHTIDDGNGFVQFSADRLIHPIVAEFANAPDSGMFSARIIRYLVAEAVADSATVVLHYDNGDPAVVVKRFGSGKVVFVSTSANMNWNNVAAKGDYVSLVFGIASYLAKSRGTHRNVTVGDAIREPLTAAEQSMALRVTRRGQPAVTPRVVSYHDEFALSLDPVEHANLYRVDVGQSQRWFAANVTTSESDLRVIEDESLERLCEGRAQILQVSDDRSTLPARVRTNELAMPALLVAAVLLLAELFMAMRFGAPQAPPADKTISRGS